MPEDDLDKSKHFGKYLSQHSALLVLKNRTLKWSRPSSFNDPFDSNAFPQLAPEFEIVYQSAIREFRNVLLNKVPSLSLSNPASKLLSQMRIGLEEGLATIDEYQIQVEQLIKEVIEFGEDFSERYHSEVVSKLEDLKILCLTRNFFNDQMWAHYSENFKGALLIFEAASRESIFTQAEEVIYSDKPYYIFDDDEFAKILTGQLSMSDNSFISRAIKKIILTKKIGWQYEQEWRINFGAGRSPQNETEYLPFDGCDLHSVLFGLRSPTDFVEKASTYAKLVNPKVRIWKSIRRPKKSEVAYERLIT
jgi:hypothetical protein